MTKKVLIGRFNNECNEHVPYLNDITAYDIAYGDELIDKMGVRDVFDSAGIEIIPSIYAVASPSAVISREAFDYIEKGFLSAVRAHRTEIDGIFLMLHGASEVEGLGSGEHHIVQRIREIVGPYLPIMIACDPHGNLCRAYVESCTLIRSYRESPHTDMGATARLVAQRLVEHLERRQNIHAVYRKLPLILGGEQSVSTDEPVRSINRYLDELEQDPRILSASWHVGYIRHDTDVAGCGVVVVPATEKDQAHAEHIADRLAAYVWERRHEFHYTGTTAEPAEALAKALVASDGPVVITDSGDNVTSGATGWNTFVLRQVLAVERLEKHVLIASICDPCAAAMLAECEAGVTLRIYLGVNHDELSASVPLDVEIKAQGHVIWPAIIGSSDHFASFGVCTLVRVVGAPIDIIVAATNHSYICDEQFVAAGVEDWAAYDIVVVKQGYIFPGLKEKAAGYVMSLTGGATYQNTARIPFKRIMRPMFPIDDI